MNRAPARDGLRTPPRTRAAGRAPATLDCKLASGPACRGGMPARARADARPRRLHPTAGT
jgi:hypothetical protein